MVTATTVCLDQKIDRILDVFDFMRDGGIFPENCSTIRERTLIADRKKISIRYEELVSHYHDFSKANRQAKAEFIRDVLHDKEILE